jgi:hypothetical protein
MRIVLLFLLLLEFGVAKKVALVIGNSNYAQGYLANPINDAKLIRDTLKNDLGFDVTYETDLTKHQMREAIRVFSLSIQKDDIALFYYSGHGMQYRNLNYLIPLKANAVTEGQIPSEGVDVSYILGGMEKAKLAILLLDACRNNPFRSFSRSRDKGLAQIRSKQRNYIVSYATEAGAVAKDGDGTNSPYALVLSELLTKPINVTNLFQEVRNKVAKRTNYLQYPYYDPHFIGNFRLSESRDNITKVDGIMYQNQPFSSQDKRNYDAQKNGGRVWDWQGAKDYCQELTLGNYTDWRLPNKEELEAIGNIEFYHAYGDYKTDAEWKAQHLAKAQKHFDDNKHQRNSSSKGHKYFVKKAFVENMPPLTGKYKSAVFWSSTERDSSYAWNVSFNGGADSWDDKAGNGYALCVR